MKSANEKRMFNALLDEVEDTLQDIEQRCLKLETADQAKELQVIFRAAHNVKGATQLYGLTEFGACVHVLEDLLAALQKPGTPLTTESIDLLLSSMSFFRFWVQSLRDNDKYVPEVVPFKDLLKQHLQDLASPPVIPAPKPAAAPAAAATEMVAPVAEAPVTAKQSPLASKEPERPEGTGSRNKRAGTLRINAQKIDEMMQLIGELSIHQGILWHNLQSDTFTVPNCKEAVELNQKTLKSLYDLVLTLRMQPAEGLLQRLEKTARDTARQLKKEIEINLSGTETLFDKVVLEIISDPLMHIVRNAVDHGIEESAAREKAGKSSAGHIEIRSHLESGQVILTISDDGGGLDPEVILNKALAKGLLPPDVKLREEEVYQLIFLPGFSTRDQVTEISGRGVGMDVVQKALHQLGGQIHIRSKKGKGTTFEITLPASLEIIDGLLIEVSGAVYVMPRQDVIEIIDLRQFPTENFARSATAIRLRDQIVPVEKIEDYVGMEMDEFSRPPLGHIALVIRLSDHSKLALRVERLIRQQQIVVRPLADSLARIPGFTGVTVLGNGEPAMILSASHIGDSYLHWTSRTGRAA